MQIVIHSGFCWSRWSPCSNDLVTCGLGGSQIAAAHISHAFVALGHNVVLFGDFCDSVVESHGNKDERAKSKQCSCGSLVLKPLKDYVGYVRDTMRIIDLLVVSRYANLLYFGANVRNTFLWCHDVVPFGVKELFTFCRRLLPRKPELTVLALTDWHCSRLKPLFSESASRDVTANLIKTSNGIDKELFESEPWSSIVPHRFIYSSACYRGLDIVLQCWSDIKMRFPDAELHVFSDFESPLVQARIPDLTKSLKKTSASLAGVVLHGFVGQNVLRDYMYSADVWFYPTKFEETYCITALECQASGTLCVCSSLAALNETVGADRGIMLPLRNEFPNDQDYVETLVNKVCDVLQNRETTFAMRRNARQWALQQTWKAVASQWLSTMTSRVDSKYNALSIK